MTRDSIVSTKSSQKMQRRVRFSRPEVLDTHSGTTRGEFVRSESYREKSQGSSSEHVQRSSSRRSQQTSNPGSYQVARDGGSRKLQYNQLTEVVSSHPRVVYESRTRRTPSSFFAGSKSGATPMPTVLPLPPQHWLGNMITPPMVKSCAQAALHEPSEGELRCLGMTLEIKTLLRMQ